MPEFVLLGLVLFMIHPIMAVLWVLTPDLLRDLPLFFVYLVVALVYQFVVRRWLDA